MKCSQALKYICDNLDAKIDSPRCREIQMHLKECPDCTAYLDSMKKTVSYYKQLPEVHVPRSVHLLLTESLKKERTKSARSRH